jgi:predicted sulfurtransferase
VRIARAVESVDRTGLGLKFALPRARWSRSGWQGWNTEVHSVSGVDNAKVEQSDYCIVNFYHLVDIDRPLEMVERHRAYMKDKEVRGRIYISEQGVNAQYGGLTADAVGYAEWLIKNEASHFAGLTYSVDPVSMHMFPKLRLQYKPNLISLAGGMADMPVTDPQARAAKVSPKDWKEMLTNGIDGKMPLVLDVRNAYEWDAGHFKGAERPLEDNFNETPTESMNEEIPRYLQGVDKDTEVMMYCTGGIRCDVYSAYLKRKGFNNLYTLEGGIQNYMKSEGLDHWNGSLYVFDGRMAIRPNKDVEEPLVPVANCALCGGTAILPHLNCANVDCNKLFLACLDCQEKHQGCCCESCVTSPRKLRPIKPEGAYGQYAKFSNYLSSSEEDE